MHSSRKRTASSLTVWGCLPGRAVPAGTCQGVYLQGGVPARGCTCQGCTCQGYLQRGVYLQGGVPTGRGVPARGGVPTRGRYLPRGVCPGGCTMWPIPSCIWCYLHAVVTPTEIYYLCTCLYSAGWSYDLWCMLGYTQPPSPVDRITDMCKNKTFL